MCSPPSPGPERRTAEFPGSARCPGRSLRAPVGEGRAGPVGVRLQVPWWFRGGPSMSQGFTGFVEKIPPTLGSGILWVYTEHRTVTSWKALPTPTTSHRSAGRSDGPWKIVNRTVHLDWSVSNHRQTELRIRVFSLPLLPSSVSNAPPPQKRLSTLGSLSTYFCG